MDADREAATAEVRRIERVHSIVNQLGNVAGTPAELTVPNAVPNGQAETDPLGGSLDY